MAFLEIKNLTHLYGQGTPYETHAIEDVSFSVERGEIIGIIGHTGSGKSTLMQHLNGLLKPDSGTVLLEGHDIWENPKDIVKVRHQVGLVFQYPEHQLFDETVYKDISYGPSNMGLVGEELQAAVRYAANLVGLSDDLLNKSPFELSGGEMRRAAIAGVIAMKPKVLILDEPTAGLDPQGRDMIISRILEYREQNNAAILISSHSMEDIARLSDKVLVMNKGKKYMFDKKEVVFSDSEKLESIGLNIPQITKLMIMLKNNGVGISSECFTVDEAVNAVREYLKTGRNGK